MKNLLFTFLFLFGAANFITAQSVISLNPQPASIMGTVDEPDVAADAVITNETPNTIHMKWDRQIINLTSGCETAVCDPNTCWARFIDTRTFDMDPYEEGDMLVHFYNNGAPCEGIVHVVITNLDDTTDVTTGVYLLNQLSGTIDLPAANVVLFPNPSTGYFSLENAENVATIRIFSLDSREVATFMPSQNNVYAIQHLAAGNYVIALGDKNGRTFQVLELSKL